jgi:hypothetical protein
MAQRIKGQEVSIKVVKDGNIVAEVNDIRSFEVGMQLEVLKEGYLGEFTDRRDDVFRGVSGKMDVHMESGSVFDLFRDLIQRSQRRTAGVTVNIQAQLQFPNGNLKLVNINDCFFGEIPLTVGGRSEYVTFTLNFEAQDVVFV